MSRLIHSSPLEHELLGRRMLGVFIAVLAYGGGLWLYVLHEVEGATEPDAPPGLIHWLRDSTLSLPLVTIGVVLGAALARALLRRYGLRSSDMLTAAVVAVVLALYASVVLSIGNPIHGQLFGSTVHGGGHDLPLGVHVVRDGLLALTANEALAMVLALVVVGRRLITSARSVPSHARLRAGAL